MMACMSRNICIMADQERIERGLPYMMSVQKGGGEAKQYLKLADKSYRFCGGRWAEGSKNPKIMWTSYMEVPEGRKEREEG